MLPYLFVYGSLRRAAATKWSAFLAGVSSFVGDGRAHGLLFQLDGYLGMTISTEEGAWVSGEVHRLNDPSSTLTALDGYEGCASGDSLPHAFERRVVSVLLESGIPVEAWAYVYVLDTQGKGRTGVTSPPAPYAPDRAPSG